MVVEEDTGDTVLIKQFDTGGAMGHGLVLRDQPGVIRSWTVSPDWIQKNVHRITNPKNLAIVTGFGDSMKGVFNPGDPLLVDTGVTHADIDGIYFFRVGEAGFVKRLQRIPTLEGVILRAKSANKDYEPFDIVKGMDFEIFGRVVKAWESEDF
ncbi:Peptidase S24-like protein [compost metagenome]